MKRTVSVGVLLLLLTACGGGSGGTESPGAGAKNGGSPGATAPAATTAGQDATTDAATTAAGDGKNPVDGTAFCAFLTPMAPRLKADGSAPGAKADFAIELATWIGNHPDQKPRTAADLDDASRQTCPKSRSTAVSAMGTSSFQEALG